jgi:hypothetical protein
VRGWRVAARRLFFTLRSQSYGTDAQCADGIADPTAIASHVDDRTTDLRYSAAILVLEEKDPPRAVLVLTPIALGPVSLLTRLDHLRAVTVGTLDSTVDPLLPPRTVVRQDERT